MSVHWPAPDRIAREHGVDAVPANDDYEMIACSWRDTAATYGLLVIGSIVFGLVIYSAIAFFGSAS